MTMELRRPGSNVERTAPPVEAGFTSSELFPSWPIAILAIPVLIRAILYGIALGIAGVPAPLNRAIPSWAQLLQATAFAGIALVLLYFGRRDRRSWSLGLFILDCGSTLAEPLVRSINDLPAPLSWALRLRTDAFQAALIWFFAGSFPSPAANRQLARLFRIGTSVAVALGAALVVMDVYARSLAKDSGGLDLLLRLAIQLQRDHPGEADWYFTLQFLSLTPLLLLQPLKLRKFGPDDRRRFGWLVGGLLIGLAPLVFVSSLPTVMPDVWAMARPHLRVIGVVVLLSLTLVPLSAAYAALVQRTLDLRLAIGIALQYLFARSAIVLLTVLPVIGLVVLVVANRDRTVVDLLAGGSGVTMLTLAIAGIMVAAARPWLIQAVDRTFFRERIDARRILADVVDQIGHATNPSDLNVASLRAVESAFHSKSVHLVVADAEGVFHSQSSDLPELAQSTTLIHLLEVGDGPLVVDWRQGSVFQRLPRPERDWLHESGAAILVPLPGATRPFHGLLAVGDKKSELPYTRDDVLLLSAMATACGIALERALTLARKPSTDSADSRTDAAVECLECGLLHDSATLRCTCGGPLQSAPLPYILEARLQIVQRIGAGGMGVVYRAIDLRLGQQRVAKTLPRTDPAMVGRLRHEARAMARVSHPNLAILYGLEIWHGTPILVMEYLGGGSLAERLRWGPLTAEQTLQLGLSMAEALRALHAAGVLHRDVKPNNIAFTSEGTPKLLDFGLAKFLPSNLRSTHLEDSATLKQSASVSTDSGAIRGTLAYLSPEALYGQAPSPADDVWSLSVTLLEASTGENPFRAANAAATVARVFTRRPDDGTATPALSSPLQQLFGELLGGLRPRTAQDLLRRLERALTLTR